jgi:hypothetical protein
MHKNANIPTAIPFKRFFNQLDIPANKSRGFLNENIGKFTVSNLSY